MALTAGFKKFIGLVAVVALVGGGIYAYKQMPKKAPEPEQVAPQEVAATPTPAPDIQPDVEQEAPVAPPPPAPTSKKSGNPANRGLDAVLNAGSK